MNEENIYRVEIETHFEAFDQQARNDLMELYGAKNNSSAALTDAILFESEVLRQTLEVQFDHQAWELATELALEHGVELDIAWSTKKARSALKKVGFISPDSRPGDARLPALFAALIAPKIQHPASTLITLLGAQSGDRIQELATFYGVAHVYPLMSLLNLSEFFSTLEGAEAIAAKLGTLEFLGAVFMIIELGGTCFWREIFSHDSAMESDEKIVEFVSAEERVFEKDMTTMLMQAGVLFRVENDPMALAVVPEELWNGLWSLGNEWIQEWSRTSFYELGSNQIQSRSAEKVLDLQSSLKWIAVEHLKNDLIDEEEMSQKVPPQHRKALSNYFGLARKIGFFEGEGNKLNPAFVPTLDLSDSLFSAEILNEWVCGFVEFVADEAVSFSSMMGLDENWRVYAHRILVEQDDFIPPWIHNPGVPTQETGHGYLRDEEIGDEEIQLEVMIVNRIFQRSKLLLLDLMSFLERNTWYSTSALCEMFQMCCSASIFSHLAVVLNDPSLRLYIPLFRASFIGGELESGRAFQIYIETILKDLFAPLGLVERGEKGFRLKSQPLRIQSLIFSEDERRQTIDEIFEGEFQFSLDPPKAKPNFFEVSEGLSIRKSIQMLVKESEGATIASFDGKSLSFHP